MTRFQLGANTPLNEGQGTVPIMTGALSSWFQDMVFVRITTEVISGVAKETETPIEFQGVIQPLKDRDLMILPEGQRSWTWLWLHCDPSLTLNTDEIVTYLGVRTRVMGLKDYRIYGYLEYKLCQNWEG